MTPRCPILLFFDFVTHYGGAQRSTVHLLSQLNRVFDVQVLDPYGVCQAYSEALNHVGVPVTVMLDQPRSCYIGGDSMIHRGVSVIRQCPDWMALSAAMKREADRIRPDIVLTNSYKAMALLWMSGVAKTVPVAYYARGWYQKQQIPWLGRWLIKKAASVLAVSHATAESLRQWPIPEKQIHVCHTVIDFESVLAEGRASSDGATLASDTAFKILLPAQLLAAKGQRIAVDAAVAMKQHGLDFVMWLAGDIKMGVDTRWVDALRETVDRQGLQSHVKFLGHRSDVRALMTQAHVVILPSQTEGFPRTIWEAMVLKCPVIATQAGGVTDLIEHDKTGLLVPFNDPQALAEAIERLAHESALASRLTQCAFDHVTQTYSERATLTQICKALMAVCER
ncbi:MAG: glycosyltransferase family 4 protein [Planctomycetes bacterium]|nr:glycosyltransferase family 4 protein [Planctomycetota bacterium]